MSSPSGLVNDSADFPEVAQAFHIANFVPVNWGVQDKISRSLVDFQFNREPQTTQWIRLALVAGGELGQADVIIRALSSKELFASGKSPLDRLGSELAQRIGCPFAPERLVKVRPVAAVKNAGIREARDKILKDTYEFDPTGLPETPRLLVIDDIITTGATFAAISTAIHAKLPQSPLTYFALARTDPWLVRSHLNQTFSSDVNPDVFRPNADLDERYFRGAASTVEKKRRPGGVRAASAASFSNQTYGHGNAAASAATPRVFGEEEEEVAVAEPHARETLPSPKAAALPPAHRPAVPVRSLWSTLKPIAIGGAALAVLLTTFFLTEEKQKGATVSGIPPTAPHESYVPRQGETVRPQSPRVKSDTRLRGIVNVPSIGLRVQPLMTSAPVPGVYVQAGERVILLRILKPEIGPDWVLIETASGKQGWVIAPVVTFSRKVTP
jgi:hypothetical protein